MKAVPPAAVRQLLLLLLPVVLAVIAVMVFVDRNDARRTENLTATEPTYNSLDELVKAADLVVIAKATGVQEGRVVSSGTDAQSGIRTQLVTLEVGAVLDGATDTNVILEQEYQLTQGTPVTVNDVAPLEEGDEALLFLVRSKDESAPYVAVVNSQGRYMVTGARSDQLTPSGEDALSKQLAALGPYMLRCAVMAAGDAGQRCDQTATLAR